MPAHDHDHAPGAVRPVLVRSVRFERRNCEIHVTEHTTSQGETSFRAAAYEPDPPTGELRPAADDAGVPYEVFGPAPSTVAERLVEMLQGRYGPRLGDPSDLA